MPSRREMVTLNVQMVAIKGHFDGKVFVPDEPVDLPRNRPLVLHVEMPSEVSPPTGCESLWEVLKKHAGSITGPSDWAAEHDHYLYGTPKREQSGNTDE